MVSLADWLIIQDGGSRDRMTSASRVSVFQDGGGTVLVCCQCSRWTSFIPTLFEMYRKIENIPKDFFLSNKKMVFIIQHFWIKLDVFFSSIKKNYCVQSFMDLIKVVIEMLPLESARLLADHDLWPPTYTPIHHSSPSKPEPTTELCQVCTRMECDQSQLRIEPGTRNPSKDWGKWVGVVIRHGQPASMLLFFP